jgi:hypothetical protein
MYMDPCDKVDPSALDIQRSNSTKNTIRPTFLLFLSLFSIYKVPYTCRHKHEKLNDYLLCEKIMKRPIDPLTILK